MAWSELWDSLIVWSGRCVLGYMLVVLGFYTFFMIVSFLQLRRSRQFDDSLVYDDLLTVSYVKPISILVPAYNEEQGIIGSVRSLLGIEYPEFEVIVINDGSKDGTLQAMIEHFQMMETPRTVRKQLDTKPVRAVYQSRLYGNLLLIDKENGGKADALNSGINHAGYPYFCSLDGDSVLERRAFLRVMKPILDTDDEVIASGGSIRIANGCRIESGEVVSIGLSRNPFAVMQVIEYLRAFLLGRVGLSRHNLLLIVSGAFGVFSKHWVVEAGGYKTNTVGEDMELVVRMHRMNRERKLGKKIIYIPDPVCWTEAPESAKYLRRQRNRWHRGLFESLMKHRSMLFNPRFGLVGLVSMPYFLLIELLGPLVEACGYVLLVVMVVHGGVYWPFAALLMGVALLYGSIFSMAAVLLEEWSMRKYPRVGDLCRLFFYALTESLWYRPMTVFWRCEGLVQWFTGRRGWGDMQRKGLANMAGGGAVVAPTVVAAVQPGGAAAVAAELPVAVREAAREAAMEQEAMLEREAAASREPNAAPIALQSSPAVRVQQRRPLAVAAVAAMLIAGALGITRAEPPGGAGAAAMSGGAKAAHVVVIDGVSLPARTGTDYLQIYRDGQWQDLFLHGVNMGMGKPGAFPGEAAITKEEYARWIRQIGEMNANVLRVYTIHPPAFYEALAEYNAMAAHPLYLLQGVWVDEDEMSTASNVFDTALTKDFYAEIKRTVDLIHGHATIEPRPGHASGTYTANVSPYVIGWVIGTEWDPYVVQSTDERNAGMSDYDGTYFRTDHANPFEIWLAKAMDETVVYEMGHYGWQRPMSFTNWVTTDPLKHPSEPLAKEDMVSVDPQKIVATAALRAGYFASYHVYPYYPDFMNYERQYTEYVDSRGERNNYAGYLHELKKEHTMPVLIAEFGVPASRGMTHRNVSGWNQGFLSEREQGEIDSRLLDDIWHERMAGGLVFTWQDEWFKRTWNTMDYDDPNRRPFWSNAQTNEQQFGLLSFDPGQQREVIRVDGETKDWADAGVKPMFGASPDTGVRQLYAASDERYVYFRLDLAPGWKIDGNQRYVRLLIDSIGGQGQHRVPGGEGLTSDAGFDFAIDIKGENDSRVWVDSYYDDFYYQYGESLKMIPMRDYAGTPDNGIFHPLRLALNKELVLPDRVGTDRIVPFEDYETGLLRYGNADPDSSSYDSLADIAVSADRSMVEMRIPWQLLNVKDPSQREVMGDLWRQGLAGSRTTDGLRLAVVAYDAVAGVGEPAGSGKAERQEEAGSNGGTTDGTTGGIDDGATGGQDRILRAAADGSGQFEVVSSLPPAVDGKLLSSSMPLYTWDRWEVPQYHERLKLSYWILQQAYGKFEAMGPGQ